MDTAWMPLVALPALFLAMLFLVKVGHRLGKRRATTETEFERVGLVSIETAIFGLLGLIFAFTYGGAATRFEARRAITVQEANNIGTAYLRLDLLPQAARDSLRAKMGEYGRTHLAAYDALPDRKAYTATLARAKAMQARIWDEAVAAVRDGPPHVALLLLPALNDMLDITVTHEAMVDVHTPGVVLAMLFALALFCSLLAGYGLAGSQSWSRYLHLVGFAFVLTAVIYVVLDYDYPRFGLIRVDFADQALRATVASMK
jgi:hypothetical protein